MMQIPALKKIGGCNVCIEQGDS
ncbi:uncharacterized protein METZ01_LOCUS235459 [marine metagenome]|uniref:Uncharacterized protein n=1 Tax=marine metagenome TaxID=408172 RepID=A0A382H648_9ZZZZ